MSSSIDVQFQALLDNTLQQVKSLFPVEGLGRTLKAENIRIEGAGPGRSTDWAAIMKAKDNNASYVAKIRANLTLIDKKTDKVLDTHKNAILAVIPHMTGMGSYVVNGKDLQVISQMRRRPGIYPSFMPDDNVKTKLTSTGADYDVIFDRTTGQYAMKVGTSNLKAVPFLLGLGVPEEKIISAIGKEAFEDNAGKSGKRDEVLQFWKKSRSKAPPADHAELVKQVNEFLESKPLDPAVSKNTIGVEHSKISGLAIVDAMKAAKEVANGIRQPADMESLVFKSIHGTEDFIKERLDRALPGIKRHLGYTVDRKDKIKGMIGPDTLSKPILSQFTTSEFTRYSSQNNPLDILSVNQGVTVMGEGGITSIHRVADEIRDIHPTHLGFIDPVHTAESCYSSDTEVMTRRGWKRWDLVTMQDELACLSDEGQLSFSCPEKLHRYPYSGLMYGATSETTGYLVTPNHRLWVRPYDTDKGYGEPKYRFELAEEGHNRPRKVRCGGHLPVEGRDVSEFILPSIQKENATKTFPPFRINDWAEFLGWYIAEGCYSYKEDPGSYQIGLSQSRTANPEKCTAIEDLLDRLELRWSKTSRPNGGNLYCVCGKQLASYLKQFGESQDKFLPEECFEWPIDARERLLDALMSGDGTRDPRNNYSCYSTASERLAKDVERLCFGLGFSVRVTKRIDPREERYFPCFKVHIHVQKERIFRCKMRAASSGYFTQEYDGEVFCATVPGGRLYCRREEKGGHWSGNSGIGLSNHFAEGVSKKGNQLYREVFDRRLKKMVEKNPIDLSDAVVAFPDQFEPDSPNNPKSFTPKYEEVAAIDHGKFAKVPVDKVDFILPFTNSPFSFVTNALPFMHSNSGARMLMAGRHLEQSVPLVDRQKPLVMTEYRGAPYHKALGRAMLTKALENGVVTKVDKDAVFIKHTGDGKSTKYSLPDHYPLNSESFMTETPIVKVGDKVKKHDTLTESNFTKDGHLALGTNLSTAIMPWRGHNFEDGIVISDSAAIKLTSEHKYELALDKDVQTAISSSKLFAQFPQLRSPDSWPSGRKSDLPSVGDIFKPGQIVVPVLRENPLNPQISYDRIHKAMHKPYMDASLRWMEHVDGEVVRVIDSPSLLKVYLKTREPMVVGDKLSQSAGGKGIVMKVLPDKEMPKDENGKTIDVLFNPLGLMGRMNPGLLFESALGKIATKTGKPYVVKSFGNPDKSQVEWVKEELKKNGLKDTEKVYDPTHNRSYENVSVGVVNWVKLKHQVRAKISARGVNDSYTIDGRPAKGGLGDMDESTSAQSMGPLELYSTLANGSTEFLKDVAGVKSGKNVDYWNAYQSGLPTPTPVVPTILDRFHTYLKGAGVNLEISGDNIKATPMTDKIVRKMSNGRIDDHGVVRASGTSITEEKGGLFDKEVTGGLQGTKWGHIELAEPVLNPLFEVPAAAILDLSAKDLNSIVGGSLYVKNDGTFSTTETAGSATGGLGIKKLFDRVDVDKDLRAAKAALTGAKKTEKPKLLKKIRYLSALKKMSLHPSEAFVNKFLPVVPPSSRPVSIMPDGNLNVADPNHGYREVLLVSNTLEKLKRKGVESSLLQPLREGLYAAVSGLTGLTEPLSRGANFRGFISTIAGKQNKHGMFQAKVIKRTQDLTGRSTIIADPKLHMDNIGIPEDMARKIFEPFVIRRMVVGYGLKPITALEEMKTMTVRAKAALMDVMKERPVIINRAPSLHKFSLVTLKPHLVPGQAIQINPLIVGGLNADFDGDAISVHTPVSEKARLEAWERLPSKNMISAKDLSVIHAPSKEALYGLYAMTRPTSKDPVTVKNEEEALKMVADRKLEINDPVKLNGKVWTTGHFQINAVLPKELHIGPDPFFGKNIKTVINSMARSEQHRAIAGDAISKLKDLGFEHATTLGTSIGLDDLSNPQIAKLHKELIADIEHTAKTNPSKAIHEGIAAAGKAMDQLKGNRLAELTYISGASGKHKGNVQQMLLTPVGVQDTKGHLVPVPILKGYSQGMDMGSYWATLPGMRKGLADRALSTADTGAFAKELQNTTIGMRIVEEDCHTDHGLNMDISHDDLVGRYIADGKYAGQLLTPELVKQLRSNDVKIIKARSPSTCEAHGGICAKCMGLGEAGTTYKKGFHVGALIGTTISEPITQMVMRSFHTGGQAGQAEVGYNRISQIFNMPVNIRGKAPLSERTGKVELIESTDRGGSEVTVAGVVHFIPDELGVGVKLHQEVVEGDRLSQTGVTHPRELAEHKGIDAARDLIINDLDSEMKASGQNIRRRIYEAAVRPLIDKAIVVDPGDAEASHSIQPGDVVSANMVRSMNRGLKNKMVVKPHIMSIKEIPFTAGDFLGSLMFQRLPRTVSQAPALGSVAPLKGLKSHPLVEFAYGKMATYEPIEIIEDISEDL